MILLWDSSNMEVELTFVDGGKYETLHWPAQRDLARDMLKYLLVKLEERGLDWSSVEGIGVFRGPGSFTGLRIGLTILNTWSNSQHVPIVGELGDGWRERAVKRLSVGENDKIVLPEYGSEARVTSPRK